jgi:hypothetical protein
VVLGDSATPILLPIASSDPISVSDWLESSISTSEDIRLRWVQKDGKESGKQPLNSGVTPIANLLIRGWPYGYYYTIIGLEVFRQA